MTIFKHFWHLVYFCLDLSMRHNDKTLVELFEYFQSKDSQNMVPLEFFFWQCLVSNPGPCVF
jgi:hypothetical protein